MATAPLIGIDVGSTSIRAVEAIRGKAANGDRPVITNFGQALLPVDAVVGGVVKDDRVVT
ncbi:MAG: pilus assembly protein PilM, partial [Jatrophihabitans sp.]